MAFQKFFNFIKSEFKLRDKILLAIISCCLLALVIGSVLFLIPGFQDVGVLTLLTAQAIAEWTGLVLFLFNGTIIKSKYWRYIVGSVMIILLSFLFKIMHLPGAIELFMSGFVLLELVYTIRFVNQWNTGLTGWLTYIWICSWIFTGLGAYVNRLSETYTLIPAILFWITLVLFLEAKMRWMRKYQEA
jgi:hypothetical protein